MAPNPELCTASRAADVLQVSKETVYRWARDGRIPVVTLPTGMKRFRLADIEALINFDEPREAS